MSRDGPEAPPTEPSPRPAIPLDYHTPEPKPASPSTLLPLLREPLGVGFIFLGTLQWFFLTNGSVAFGACLIFGGSGWCVLHDSHRGATRRQWLWRAQVILTCAVASLGFFLLSTFLQNARPAGWEYWLTENQNYGYTRSRALPLLWLPAAGVAWLTLLGIGWVIVRLAPSRAARNNRPPDEQQER